MILHNFWIVSNVKILLGGRLYWPSSKDIAWVEDNQLLFLISHTFVCKFGWVEAVPAWEKCYRQMDGKLEKLEIQFWKKLFAIGFPYKHYNFWPLYLPVKMASKNIIRSIGKEKHHVLTAALITTKSVWLLGAGNLRFTSFYYFETFLKCVSLNVLNQFRKRFPFDVHWMQSLCVWEWLSRRKNFLPECQFHLPICMAFVV